MNSPSGTSAKKANPKGSAFLMNDWGLDEPHVLGGVKWIHGQCTYLPGLIIRLRVNIPLDIPFPKRF